MNLHLVEIAAAVVPGAHAVLLPDQAGWHMSTRLAVPPNVTIIALPPKCPELNPVDNVWQLMRDNRLSNRILQNCRHASFIHSRSCEVPPRAPSPLRCLSGRLKSGRASYCCLGANLG
jgi:transposase